MKPLLLFLFLTGLLPAQITEAQFTTFRDSEYHYSLRYPRSWLPVDPSNLVTRFKAVSEGGSGSADFSINVVPKPEAKGKTPEAYYKAIKDNPKNLIDAMRRYAPTAQLKEHGETKIANQPAFYLVYELTQQGGPIEIKLRTLQFSFGRDGYSYTMTMRSYTEEWAINRPMFDYIAFSYMFSPNA